MKKYKFINGYNGWAEEMTAEFIKRHAKHRYKRPYGDYILIVHFRHRGDYGFPRWSFRKIGECLQIPASSAITRNMYHEAIQILKRMKVVKEINEPEIEPENSSRRMI